MKPSEMTNEILADELMKPLVGSRIVIEAAARLRTFTLLSKAHQRLANDSVDYESNLLRKLKLAENALGESRVAICHICDQKHTCGFDTEKFDPCCIRKDIDRAIVAIRGEGDSNDNEKK